MIVNAVRRKALTALKRVFGDPRQAEAEKRQALLEDGCRLYRDLSEKGDISNIVFRDGDCVFNLKDGRAYVFDAGDRVARMYSVPHTGGFEPQETEMVRSMITPGSTCIDVGANFGWYTVLLSMLAGASGRVLAFEPLPQTMEVLKRNVALNGCGNVSMIAAALDSSAGDKVLYLPDIGVSGAFKLHAFKRSFQKITCPSIRLDDYCRENGIRRVDFIKADIEGAEWRMLEGARETLLRDMPVMMLEIQRQSTTLYGYQPHALIEWLVKLGYVPHFIDAQGTLTPLKGLDGPDTVYNYFFLRG